MKMEDLPGSDSLRLSVFFSSDLVSLSHKYVLIGQSRGIVCYGANMVGDRATQVAKVPRRAFPTGIARFTLLNSDRQPLNERILFIDQEDALRVHIDAGSGSYGPRDSIALQLTVTDAAGQPVSGSFSLAVTDETQIREDSLQHANIITRLLLSSDLQGAVEDPAYYFQHRDSGTTRALDNLLLTQGWVGYDWKKIFGPPPSAAFLPEPEFIVRGRALNVFNKPVKGTRVDLVASGGIQVAKDTITDDQGVFVFDKFPPFDTAAFFIQARNRKGKEFNIGVEMEETPPPALTADRPFPILPWYVNDQESFSAYLATNTAYRQEQDNILYPGKGKALPTVTVFGKKVVRDSKNLNGPGNADQVITEEDLQKQGKTNLLQLLEKEVNGFHEGVVRRSTQLTFMIHEKRVRFVFDGVNLNYVMPGSDYNTLRSYLETYTAEDIKGIEVMFNPSHTSTYGFRYQSTRSIMSGNDYAYLEITTRSGHGPFQNHTPGTYLFRPQPFYIPRQFYRPRYTSGQAAGDFVDMRSTIHWSPDVITDTSGKATISFFAADRPATYHIIAEGSDMIGSFGVEEKEITIRKP